MSRSARDSDDDNDGENLPEDYFEVESIVDGRRHRGRWQFLVRWVGYTDKDNSWVFEGDFGDNCLDMIREFKANRQQQSKKAPAAAVKPAPTSRPRKRSRRSASPSSSSNDQTDSLSDDHLPLSNRLRRRKSSASSSSVKAEPEEALSAPSPPPPTIAQPPAPSNEQHVLMRVDSETSANSNQTELITDDDHNEALPVAAPEPVVDVTSTTATVVDVTSTVVEAAADVVDVPAPPSPQQPAPVVVEAAAVVPAAVPQQDAAGRTGPKEEPPLAAPTEVVVEAAQHDPDADLLCESVFCRALAPEERFPKSVSEICAMMGTLDERGRIDLIDHLTFRVGYAEMFALISTQRPFLTIFEKWLVEAYRSGSPRCIAFIRSALTLMSVFPGSKIANYRRLIKIIREWVVIDPVCMNLADRVLKQWQYHKEISQHGRPSTSQLPSPTDRSPSEVFSPPIPVPVRTAPAAAAIPLAPGRAVEPAPLPTATEADKPEPVDVAMDTAEVSSPSADSAGGSESVAVAVDSTQPAESTLNQVEVEQDHTITYMPAGLDDDLDYPADEGTDWMTVSIS